MSRSDSSCTPLPSAQAERLRTRIDLAAAHRLACMYNMHEGIFNHLTARVPGTQDSYYQIPFGTHWSEVCASSFMEVGYDGTVIEGSGYVEESAFGIHVPVHQYIPTAAAVFHTHMPFAAALTRLEDPHILPIGQTELGVMRQAVYELDYHGPSIDKEEGNRLVALLQGQQDKSIVFMANHGVLTFGSIAHAFDRLYYVERVAQVQLYAMWTGRPLRSLPPQTVEATRRIRLQQKQYGEKTYAEHHFEALKRVLDRREPDYRD